FVTHSTGGGIARQIALGLKDGMAPALVIERIVSLAPPHYGSEWARVASHLGVSQKLLADLQNESVYLQELSARWSSLPSAMALIETCIVGAEDRVVTAASSSWGCQHTVEIART